MVALTRKGSTEALTRRGNIQLSLADEDLPVEGRRCPCMYMSARSLSMVHCRSYGLLVHPEVKQRGRYVAVRFNVRVKANIWENAVRAQ